MKFFEKNVNLQSCISYNIFVFSGYIASVLLLLVNSYPSFINMYVVLCNPYQHFILYIFWNFFFLLGIIVAIIFLLLEQVFDIKIKNSFWLNNTILNKIRIIGCFLSIGAIIALFLFAIYIYH